MQEVLADFKKLILDDPRAAYIKAGGGVLISQDNEEIPLQKKTPYVALLGRDAGGILHWSSRKRWIPFILEVVAVQRNFERENSVASSLFKKGVSEVAKDLRFIVDMNRINGKYARVLLREEGQPQKISEGNMHLLGKALTFEIVRIE